MLDSLLLDAVVGVSGGEGEVSPGVARRVRAVHTFATSTARKSSKGQVFPILNVPLEFSFALCNLSLPSLSAS